MMMQQQQPKVSLSSRASAFSIASIMSATAGSSHRLQLRELRRRAAAADESGCVIRCSSGSSSSGSSGGGGGGDSSVYSCYDETTSDERSEQWSRAAFQANEVLTKLGMF